MKIAYLEDLKKLTDGIGAKIKEQFTSKSNLDSSMSVHNTSSISHEDIRGLISTLTNRLNALADSDDETLDQLSEIVAYIKSNKDLIEAVTTSKVSVSDIIDSLNSIATDKPLSANQGNVLKNLIGEVNTKMTISYALKSSVEDLKKFVSNGKELVADAITEKGVETAADAAFATMAENIGQIEAGTGGDVNLLETLEFTSFVNPEYAGTDFAATWSANDTEYDGVKNVSFKGLIPQNKFVTPTTSAQVIRADVGKVLNSVSVAAIDSNVIMKDVVMPSSGNTTSVNIGFIPAALLMYNYESVLLYDAQLKPNYSIQWRTSGSTFLRQAFEIGTSSAVIQSVGNTYINLKAVSGFAGGNFKLVAIE